MPRLGTEAEWLSSNAGRPFPMKDGSDFSTASGGTLPMGVMLDFRAVIVTSERTGGKATVRLQKVLLAQLDDGTGHVELSFLLEGVSLASPNALTQTMSARVPVGGLSVVRSRSVLHRQAVFGGESRSGVPEIVDVMAVVGFPVDAMPGQYFMDDPPEIVPSRVLQIPGGIGVDTLVVDGQPLTGVVRVIDGLNTTMRISEGAVVLDVDYGIGKGYACPELKDVGCRFVKYVNGQRAASDGDFSIAGGEGISVSSGSWGDIPAVVVSASSSVGEFALPRKDSQDA